MSLDSLYVSYVTSTNDLDFFTIPNPAAGSTIRCTSVTSPADYDLAVYAPADEPMRTAVGEPLDGAPLGDAGRTTRERKRALSPEALDDLRIVPNEPLVGVSANRGLEDDTVTAIASGTGDYTFQVTPYNGSSSNEPYVLRVEITPPRQPLDADALPPIAPAAASAADARGRTNTLFLVNRGALEAQYPGSSTGRRSVDREHAAVAPRERLRERDRHARRATPPWRARWRLRRRPG